MRRSFESFDDCENLIITVDLLWHDLKGERYKTHHLNYFVPDNLYSLNEIEQELKNNFGSYEPEMPLLIKAHGLEINPGVIIDEVNVIAFQPYKELKEETN